MNKHAPTPSETVERDQGSGADGGADTVTRPTGARRMSDRLIPSDYGLVDAKKRWSKLHDMELRHDREYVAAAKAMTNEELYDLIRDAALFGQTNCGWYQYRAMHVAAAEARSALYARGLDPDERPWLVASTPASQEPDHE